jgi:DNA-binding NarL/FixJ family response regulator
MPPTRVVIGVDDVVDAVNRVASGGSALDPEVISRMLGRRSEQSPLAQLTSRELDVLGAMAQGMSNMGIAGELFVTEAAVEKYVTRIFQKLGLGSKLTEHRRVLAVLTYVRSSSG